VPRGRRPLEHNRTLPHKEVTIQFESHRVELPAIFELEYTTTVCYDQAPSIGGREAPWSSSYARLLRDPYGLRRMGECKNEEELIRLSERKPIPPRSPDIDLPAGPTVRNGLVFTIGFVPPPGSTGFSIGISSSSKTTSERRRRCHPLTDSGYSRTLRHGLPACWKILSRRPTAR
jgi:hypothetical protein